MTVFLKSNQKVCLLVNNNENLLKNKNFLPRIINYKLDCYNCNWNCKYRLDNWPCISRINVEMVRKKVNELLKEELC